MTTAVLIFILSASAQMKVSEEMLGKCYEVHPYFQEAIMGVSDEDFANKTKSAQRKQVIQADHAKNSNAVRTCLDQVIQFAKDQKDPANLKYVILRLSEISSVVHADGSKQTPAVSK